MRKILVDLGANIDSSMNELSIHEQYKIKYKIDVNEEISAPQIALCLANTKKEGNEILGTLGNFSLIIGKAKSRKSFYINIVISTALIKDNVLGRFLSNLPSNKCDVLYFDTEQGKYHVQKAVKRICTQIDEPQPKNLQTYYLRSLTPTERLQFIETLIYSNDKIGIVVIDGIKDLITSINDEEQATMIVSKLLKWSEEKNIHIITVLHQNKGDANARGHIGTELINKAETVLEVAKVEGDNNISIVTPMQCRNPEPEVFAFEIDEFGIPIETENFEIKIQTKQNKNDLLSLENHIKYEVLTKVFSKSENITYSELVTQIKQASIDQYKTLIGDNKAKEFIVYCKNNEWLLQKKFKAPYTLGIFKKD